MSNEQEAAQPQRSEKLPHDWNKDLPVITHMTAGAATSEPQRSESRCRVRGESSRVCELGTKGCVISHSPDYAASGEPQDYCYFSQPQDWTAEHVAVLLNGGGGISDVAAAHNSALDAIKKNSTYQALGKKVQEIGKLKRELAAGEEKRKSLVEALELGIGVAEPGQIWSVNPSKFKDFLKAGNAALAKVKERAGEGK